MFCAACGATNPDGTRFCAKCGKPLAAAAPAAAYAPTTPAPGASPGGVPGGAPAAPAALSKAAVWSLVMAFVPLCGIAQLTGLILGIVALVKINGSGGRLRGMGLAIGGLVASVVVGLFGIPIVAAILIPALLSSRGVAQETQVRAELMQIRSALAMYEANSGRLPSAEEGLDGLVDPTVPGGPYLDQSGAIDDPWGNRYIYELRMDGGYELRSIGPDGSYGTDDDIVQ